MKKSNLVTLLVFFLLIPVTVILGTRLPGRSYYITGTLLILELMIPMFVAFEGKKPQARELVIIAVMCAIAIAGRVAIPLPHFKAVFALVMLAGVAFGPETGFMVGAITAFVSNFFYGQGAYTPWQMMAYGAGGMLAGFCFAKGRLPKSAAAMALFGFFAVVLWVGPLLDASSLFLMITAVNTNSIIVVFTAGFPANIANGICTVLVMLLLGKPLLDKLDRIQVKYGILEQNTFTDYKEL